ncbi:protein AE7-like [Macadamia integrifolia]|uniref:protein AE7-like n=1 Tax=Macadamia integrifolia TaxID=60698 RepID=UPI001C4F687A|nr:protein AE7-like [Macadamia integrifolia]
MVSALINANPVVYGIKERRVRSAPSDVDEYAIEPINQEEIFDHIRDIKDPEHPYSLEELKVVTDDAIEVDDKHNYVRVTFTPTVEHCSMAIGYSYRPLFTGATYSESTFSLQVVPLNTQLNDKERVAAALENPSLLSMVDDCLARTYA